MRRVNALALALLLSSCSMLNPLSIPNPLEDGKGINTDVAIGQTVETNKTKGLVNVDRVDIGRDNSNTSNSATTMTINQGMDKRMLILIICLVAFIILLAGMAIPTRGQANRIKELKENLAYERERTNLVVEAAAEGQKARQTQNI